MPGRNFTRKEEYPNYGLRVQGKTANGEKSGVNGRNLGVNGGQVGRESEIREIYGLWAGSEWEGRA
jgi:hypothetical protein